MFVDASALTAILIDEEDASDLVRRIEGATRRLTSPMSVWETALAVARVLDLRADVAGQAVLDYLAVADIELVDIPGSVAVAAIEAHLRFGKGKHPARLNFGDCFAYACARHFGQPLLFKGSDFPHTDFEAA